ncbi:MAG: PIG-L deacetylase family protein [Candidatus Acidiferrum sp.]
MEIRPQRVLALAPHTDDAELGCGGTLSRLLEEDTCVCVAAFSTAEESLPVGSPPGLLRAEFADAMGRMGIPEKNTRVFNFPVRRLSYHRQEVLDEIVKLRKELDPEMVFLPSGNDLHQDHHVVNEEGLRVFKERTVWGYELPWNQIEFSAQAFVTLERKYIEAKWNALQAYKSQLDLGRPYFSWTFIEGLARVRGVQVKAEYAEVFEVMRLKW